VDVTTREDYVLLVWTDDESGMSSEVTFKAFMPLFTTKKTGSRPGLFIASTIVESHGGRISVDPVRAGGGGSPFNSRSPVLLEPQRLRP
jgi:C4-dicarboxylate-specific signal transduction histidine kinase